MAKLRDCLACTGWLEENLPDWFPDRPYGNLLFTQAFAPGITGWECVPNLGWAPLCQDCLDNFYLKRLIAELNSA